jgi:hypothetical protein
VYQFTGLYKLLEKIIEINIQNVVQILEELSHIENSQLYITALNYMGLHYSSNEAMAKQLGKDALLRLLKLTICDHSGPMKVIKL